MYIYIYIQLYKPLSLLFLKFALAILFLLVVSIKQIYFNLIELRTESKRAREREKNFHLIDGRQFTLG